MRNQANPHLALLDQREIDRLNGLARKLIEHRKRALEARFGWTYLRADIVASAATQQLTVSGTVIFPGLGRQLAVELQTIIPNDWMVVNRLRSAPAGGWYSLRPGITRLESSLGLSPRGSVLTTELFQRDGPVQCLAITPKGRLVRALDGTVGWTRRSLGASYPATIPQTDPRRSSPANADCEIIFARSLSIWRRLSVRRRLFGVDPANSARCLRCCNPETFARSNPGGRKPESRFRPPRGRNLYLVTRTGIVARRSDDGFRKTTADDSNSRFHIQTTRHRRVPGALCRRC